VALRQRGIAAVPWNFTLVLIARQGVDDATHGGQFIAPD
jgi:hypothetical protein